MRDSMKVSRRWRRRLSRRRQDARGAAAILVALSLVALLVASAMVLDFGLVRIDRQVDKSAADSAVTAGLAGLVESEDGKAHPYLGVCGALRYLQASDARFSTITSTSGAWTDGGGVSTTGDGCTDATWQAKVCDKDHQSTWATFVWTDKPANPRLTATIQSGYQLGSAPGWQEDALPAAAADQDDHAGGCDQLAVTITQKRRPGLGSIASSSDLVTSIRSVGRVTTAPGDDAPAMLLLKRTGCTSLEVGSSAGSSWVRVFGSYSTTTGASQAGSIHADADGLNCSSSVFYGKASSGIIAYAAKLSSGRRRPDEAGLDHLGGRV